MSGRILPVAMAALTLAAACSNRAADKVADPAAAVTARADSVLLAVRADAEKMRNDARTTLAELLRDPATASFDSLMVVQPPAEEGRVPPMAACGRIGGRPGIAGSNVPTRFVYQSRFTVFVEEEKNREEFAALWERTCSAPGRTVILQD